MPSPDKEAVTRVQQVVEICSSKPCQIRFQWIAPAQQRDQPSRHRRQCPVPRTMANKTDYGLSGVTRSRTRNCRAVCVRFDGGRLESDGGPGGAARGSQKRLGHCRAPSRLRQFRCARSSEHHSHEVRRREPMGAACSPSPARATLTRRARASKTSGRVRAACGSPARERHAIPDVAVRPCPGSRTPHLARTGGMGADDDPSVLRSFERRAPTHARARH